MTRILISIPIHERLEVFYDQCANIRRFVPEATIVAHISRDFRTRFKRPVALEEQEGLLVNSHRRSTKSEGLLPVHLSNFAYACSRTDADWFVINASNDLYVRPGLADHLSRFGAFARPVPLTTDSTWAHADRVRGHAYLQDLAAELGVPVSASTPEGTAYPAAMLHEFTQHLTVDRPYVAPPTPYPDEETVLPTMLSARDVSVGLPFILSEVTAEQPLTVDMIDAARAGAFTMRQKQFYGSGAARQAYEPDGVFGVKRVPRVIDHPLRAYIRSMP